MKNYIITMAPDSELDRYYYKCYGYYAFAYCVPEEIATLYKLKGYSVLVTDSEEVLNEALHKAAKGILSTKLWFD